MKLLSLLMLIVSGCSSYAAAPDPEARPITNGNLLVTVDGIRATVETPESGQARRTYFTTVASYKNVSDHPIWITGYAKDRPFWGIETRALGGP